jgi:hypothetical protein
MTQVVGALISAGDREHPDPQDVGDAVGDEQRIARIGDPPKELVGLRIGRDARHLKGVLARLDDWLPSVADAS